MCGIAGILSLPKSLTRVTSAEVGIMRDTMVHRGPDGAGTWVSDDGLIGLGHRRLSIVDLSDAAAQPMSDAAGEIWLTYKGEIYNHRELRAELESLGHQFRTDHSDTEVIIYAFREWGIECLQRFRGMFAFALWDARSQQLWLVRDRVGIKPLYYTKAGGRLVFASEIKALLTLDAVNAKIDENSFFDFLSFLTVPAPNTLFEGIKKLPGGTWMLIRNDGAIEEQRYWDAFDGINEFPDATIAELGGNVLNELRTSIDLRKSADVPVGVFLSGGIDSSTNAALFSENENAPIHTFSIGYDEEYSSAPSELVYARAIADRLGANHHEIKLTQQDLVDFLPRMVALQDEPIADPVCVPLYYVSKLARDHGVVVCQVGEGADELFWGYPSWKRALRLQWASDTFPVPQFLKRLALWGFRKAGQDHRHIFEMLTRSADGLPVFWGGAEIFTHSEKMRLLSPRLRQKLSNQTSWRVIEPIRRRFLERSPDRSTLSWMTYLDLNIRLPELLLMRVDKMSMGASIECRVPFLDHRFIALAMGIPQAIKTKGGILKGVLKHAVRGLIPDSIIDRPKQGFSIPVHEWLLRGLGDEARIHVLEFATETGLLDPVQIDELFDNRPGDTRIWALLNLALWWKHYVR